MRNRPRRSRGPSFARLRSTGGGERDNWDGSRRLRAVLSESLYTAGLQRVLVVPFGALQSDGVNVDDVVANFDADVGAGLQVPVPLLWA